jgi:DNA-binding PadR family transcriptional regulator
MIELGGFGRRRGLRQWILLILGKGPKNGAEVMDAMETVSQGWWRPSPGSVYPTLEDLSEAGIIRRREDGRYELTSKGRESSQWTLGWLTSSPRTPKEIVEQVGSLVAYLEDISSTDARGVSGESERLRKLGRRLQDLAH